MSWTLLLSLKGESLGFGEPASKTGVIVLSWHIPERFSSLLLDGLSLPRSICLAISWVPFLTQQEKGGVGGSWRELASERNMRAAEKCDNSSAMVDLRWRTVRAGGGRLQG
jgi:hypothetical protein